MSSSSSSSSSLVSNSGLLGIGALSLLRFFFGIGFVPVEKGFVLRPFDLDGLKGLADRPRRGLRGRFLDVFFVVFLLLAFWSLVSLPPHWFGAFL